MHRSKENTWRVTQGKKPLKPMEDVVSYLMYYINTYPDQPGYEEYNNETFINDILYGLGVSISEEYRFATGATKFKELLIKQFKEEGII
jgi:hypothetical protein